MTLRSIVGKKPVDDYRQFGCEAEAHVTESNGLDSRTKGGLRALLNLLNLLNLLGAGWMDGATDGADARPDEGGDLG